jgi:hypothetical protein
MQLAMSGYFVFHDALHGIYQALAMAYCIVYIITLGIRGEPEFADSSGGIHRTTHIFGFLHVRLGDLQQQVHLAERRASVRLSTSGTSVSPLSTSYAPPALS